MNLKKILCLLAVSASLTAGIAQQPYGGSWHLNYVRDWTPESDPDAKFNKSTVALQPRIEDDVVKANSNQFSDGKVAACLTMNPSCSMTPSQGANNFIGYNPTYWQYMDMLVWWGGSSGEGVVIPPTAPVTDICHLNGVKVLGIVFFSPTSFGGRPEWVDQMLTEEGGKYPYAEKLYQIADYYGFDGWFINAETVTSTGKWDKFIEYFYQIAEADGNHDMEIQWYDAKYTSPMDLVNVNSNVSYMVNYGMASSSSIASEWSKYSSAGYSKDDFFSKAYFGVEQAQGGIEGNASYFESCFPATGHAASIQIFNPEEGIWKKVVENLLDQPTNCGTTAYNAMNTVFKNEARFWTNVANDPSDVSGRNGRTWPGLANAIVEHSTIQSLPFVTSFSAGLGKHRFVNGENRGTQDWYHRGMQDILPTWRWWVESSSSDQLTFTFNWDDAYNIGTSVTVSGNMTANADHLTRLYKTNLKISSGDKFQLVYKTNSQNSIEVKLGIKENGNAFQTFQATASEQSNGWTVSNIDLSSLAGKTVSIIALNFKTSSTVSNYETTLGQLGIIPSGYSQSLKVSNLMTQNELKEDVSDIRLVWDAPQSDKVHHYNVYMERNGQRTLVGQTRDEGFYIDKFKRNGSSETSLKLEVAVVTKDMTECSPVQIVKTFPAMTAPVITIKASQTLIKAGEQVTFTATGTNNPTAYDWTVPQGATEVSRSGNSITLRFDNEGFYSIGAKVTNAIGTSSKDEQNLIEVNNTKTIENVALQGVINDCSNSVYQEGPENIIDGKKTGCTVHQKWCTGGSKEHYVIVDLKQSYQIYKFYLVEGSANEAGMPNLDCYRVELSNDLKNWTAVLDEQGRSYENKHTDWIKGSVGRYVKLVPYDNEKPITIRVWEFEIWGAESPLSIDNMADQQLKVNESATFEIGYDLGGDKADNFEATVTSDNENVVKVTETTDDAANSKIRFTLQAQSQIGEANITVSIVNGEYVNSTAFSVEVSSDEVTNLLFNLVPTVTYAAGGDYPADANTDPKAASDGNESTVFDSAFTFDGQSVIEMMYILGEQKDVVRVRALMGERDDARGYAPAIGMKVLAKAVDTEMAEVANVDNSAQNTELAYTFDSPVKAYTLKFQFTTEDYMGVEFKELEAYGAKSDITDMTVQPDIRIYPGMADRGEPIYVTAADIEKVSLVSMQGTVMKELKSADGSTVEIETGNLPAGTYLLVIEGGSYRETAKVVIR